MARVESLRAQLRLRIAELFANLSDAGVDGFLLTWLDYEGGLDRFGREVLPRLEKAGLRAPATP